MPVAKLKSRGPAADPVLRRLRAALDEIYGDRIERIVLFGSRARGRAHAKSDYDVAVFLKDLTDFRAERRRLINLKLELMDETGEDIQAIPFPAGSYGERTPLMHEIRLDGIDLGPPGPPLSLYAPLKTQEAGMSPEAAFYMAKARQLLQRAHGNLSMEFPSRPGGLPIPPRSTPRKR
jgi:predicted nucleotidyltransferase